jgi:hypothetical protein
VSFARPLTLWGIAAVIAACDFSATYRLADGGDGLVESGSPEEAGAPKDAPTTDSPSSSCGHTFCSNFDTAPGTQWAACTDNFGPLTLKFDDTDGRSRPASLLTTGPNLAASGAAAGCVEHVVARAFTVATLEFALNMNAGIGNGTDSYINVAGIVTPRRELEIQIRVASAINDLKLVEHSFPDGGEDYNVKTYAGAAPTNDAWHTIRLVVNEGTSPATATLTIDSTLFVALTLNNIATAVTEARMVMGIPHIKGPISGYRTRIDDVTLDLE